MTTQKQCLKALQGYIERADRGELAEAQAAIIQFALSFPILEKRSEAMGALQGALAEAVNANPSEPMQQAFHSVVDAMIDRTRDAVLGSKAG